jgi:hypothetical protein
MLGRKNIKLHDVVELLIDPEEGRLQFWNKKPVKKGMKATVVDIYPGGTDFCLEIPDPQGAFGVHIALIDMNIAEVKILKRFR